MNRTARKNCAPDYNPHMKIREEIQQKEEPIWYDAEVLRELLKMYRSLTSV